MATDPCSRQLDGVNPPSISPSVFATRRDNIMISAMVLPVVLFMLCIIIYDLLSRRRAAADSARRHLSRRPAADSAPPHLSRRPAADKGLEKKVLKSLPKQLITYIYGEEKLSDCAICLSDFAAGDQIRLLSPCGHGFHVGCIDTWLGSHSSCPSCRSENNDVVIKVSDENFS